MMSESVDSVTDPVSTTAAADVTTPAPKLLHEMSTRRSVKTKSRKRVTYSKKVKMKKLEDRYVYVSSFPPC